MKLKYFLKKHDFLVFGLALVLVLVSASAIFLLVSPDSGRERYTETPKQEQEEEIVAAAPEVAVSPEPRVSTHSCPFTFLHLFHIHKEGGDRKEFIAVITEMDGVVKEKERISVPIARTADFRLPPTRTIDLDKIPVWKPRGEREEELPPLPDDTTYVVNSVPSNLPTVKAADLAALANNKGGAEEPKPAVADTIPSPSLVVVASYIPDLSRERRRESVWQRLSASRERERERSSVEICERKSSPPDVSVGSGHKTETVAGEKAVSVKEVFRLPFYSPRPPDRTPEVRASRQSEPPSAVRANVAAALRKAAERSASQDSQDNTARERLARALSRKK